MGVSLKSAFLQFIQQHKLFDKRKNVLIALSGGIDSMVLLYLLLEWQKYLNLNLAAVHINHQLRGRESVLDQEFVKAYCKQKKVLVYIEEINVRKVAKENKYSLEEAGHIYRDQIYQRYLSKGDFNAVATAHNLNDQAETILMHILEGTGLDGLAGIHLQKQELVRPLLFAPRQEIERYARQKKIPFREDRSNKDLRFKRNKIRHELLPFLEREFSLGKLDNFLKMSLILQEWFSYSERQLTALEKKVKIDKQKVVLKISDFRRQFSGIQIKVLENILRHLTDTTSKLDFNSLQGFMTWLEQGKKGTKFRLHPEVTVRKQEKNLAFQRIPDSSSKIKLEIPSENVYNLSESGIRFSLKEIKPRQVKFTENHSVEFIDREKIKFPLILRNWRRGDRFQPLGAPFSRLVSDFLTDLKIEFPWKKNVLVLEQRGEIVAIPNFRISEKYKLTKQTKRVLQIELRNDKQS